MRTRTSCASVARPPTLNGYHTLIEISNGEYQIPQLATVTLEKVEEPGEWEVRGLCSGGCTPFATGRSCGCPDCALA